MNQVSVVMKYTLLEYLSIRRFYFMLFFVSLFGVGLTLGAFYARPSWLVSSVLSFYDSWWISWGGMLSMLIPLSAIFFGGDAISSELQKKTGYFSLANPIGRRTFFFGKWLAAFLASSIILMIAAVFAVANQIFYFGMMFPSQFGYALVFSWIFLAAELGVAFLFGSLFRHTTPSLIFSIVFLFYPLPTLVENLTMVLGRQEPWFLLIYGAGIIGSILAPGGYPPHVVTSISQGPTLWWHAGSPLTTFYASLPEGLAIMLVYFVAAFLLGATIFGKREFS